MAILNTPWWWSGWCPAEVIPSAHHLHNHHSRTSKEKQLDILLFRVKFIYDGLWNNSGQERSQARKCFLCVIKLDESISQETESKLCQGRNNISLQIKKSKANSSVHPGHLATVWRRSSRASASSYMRLDPEGQANTGVVPRPFITDIQWRRLWNSDLRLSLELKDFKWEGILKADEKY